MSGKGVICCQGMKITAARGRIHVNMMDYKTGISLCQLTAQVENVQSVEKLSA